jgi:D-beta-D-heptose 7-phosphate kinase/D-beta-D-heptose 1-phosphate adenosyltransferase
MQDIIFKDKKSAKVLVVGDIILDQYIYGETNRISPEAPVPIVKVNNTEERPGGAANVALNVASLGPNTYLLGVTGNDEASKRLENILTKENVNCHFIYQDNYPTITKRRVLSRHQQLIRLDYEDDANLVKTDGFVEKYIELLEHVDIVILSDYAKGGLINVNALIKHAKTKNIPVLVDPKSKDFNCYKNANILTPNEKEFEIVVGNFETDDALNEKAEALLKSLDLDALLITRGEKGMVLVQKSVAPIYLKAAALEVFDVTGAGDTVIAVLAVALVSNLDLETATLLANTAAGLVVGKLGTATVSADEINKNINNSSNLVTIVDKNQALKLINESKERGERVIMTNGCFDIIHAGHVSYLMKAKSLGDFLIVALNDDDSVKRLKGNGRPINTLENRMAVLNGLASVNLVVPFSEDTPEELVSFLGPDVLVKGGDYKEEDIAGAKSVKESGGDVVILPFEEGCSTSLILKKMNTKK